MGRVLKKEGTVAISAEDMEVLRGALQQLGQIRLSVAGILYNIGNKYGVTIPPDFELDGDSLKWEVKVSPDAAN